MMASTGWQPRVVQRIIRLRNRYFLFLDVLSLPLAAWLAFAIRLERFDLGEYAGLALISALLAWVIKTPLLMVFGVYSRYWIFAGLREIGILLEGAVAGVTLQGVALVALSRFVNLPQYPLSVPFLDGTLTFIVLAMPRLCVHGLYTVYQNRFSSRSISTRRVLIVGAGEAGNLIYRELVQNPRLDVHPVGFVDDDERKRGLYIGQIRVLGAVKDLPELVRKHKVEQVLIAIPSASPSQIRRIVDRCQVAGAEPRILPGFYELLSGRVQARGLRPVRVEDLLSRKPIHTDITRVKALLKGKRVLVTGAGGSIGAELCRQIANCDPASLILLGHGENSIFNLHLDMARLYPDLNIAPVIADIRDLPRLEAVFRDYHPEIILHAAAHKHVPLMEVNPQEAFSNNVGGTWNLLRLAELWGVERFVMISTDKAVNPTSVMGATKRIAELLVQDGARRSKRCFVAVRFGNVLGSRGSVVPYFEQQIARGGPVTVTHPEVTRYFMTIPEAVQLVLQAGALGDGSGIFVLDMGEPVKIVDLARDVIRLAGLREGVDIEIVFSGLRHGEKLHEELFTAGERYHRTSHEKIFVSNNVCVPLEAFLHTNTKALLDAARRQDLAECDRLVRVLVPEYQPQSESKGNGDSLVF
ncbi:MAG: polysaccharide biosynthesis protein [Anaerolineae bacterium]|nr:polysaccharide biosynthesis protein [Anaerolineae bacterium]